MSFIKPFIYEFTKSSKDPGIFLSYQGYEFLTIARIGL